MSGDQLQEIIDFAIGEEHRFTKIYADAAEKTPNPRLKSLLTEMSRMEAGHAAILAGYKRGMATKLGVTVVQDLKIGEYLATVGINEASSVQDILVFAIKSEMSANKLYLALAARVGDAESKDLFEKLAQEELKHKNDLEKVYDDDVYKEN